MYFTCTISVDVCLMVCDLTFSSTLLCLCVCPKLNPPSKFSPELRAHICNTSRYHFKRKGKSCTAILIAHRLIWKLIGAITTQRYYLRKQNYLRLQPPINPTPPLLQLSLGGYLLQVKLQYVAWFLGCSCKVASKRLHMLYNHCKFLPHRCGESCSTC